MNKNTYMFLILVVLAMPAFSADRMALLVANNDYVVNPLTHAIADVRLVREALEASGFEVMVLENGSRKALRRMVSDFVGQIGAAKVVLFYYAGIGIQYDGENYLLPADADVLGAYEFPDVSLRLSTVVRALNFGAKGNVIYMLDGNYSQGFVKPAKLDGEGLYLEKTPDQSLVFMSSSPGSLNSRPTASTSLFAQAVQESFNSNLQSSDELIEQLKLRVSRKSKGEQEVWVASTIPAPFDLQQSSQLENNYTVVSNQNTDTDTDGRDVWEMIKNSNRAEDFNLFLSIYPDSKLAPFVQSRLNSLQSAQQSVVHTKPDSGTATQSVTIENHNEEIAECYRHIEKNV